MVVHPKSGNRSTKKIVGKNQDSWLADKPQQAGRLQERLTLNGRPEAEPQELGPTGTRRNFPLNQRIAACFREASDILASQDASVFRVGAYRRAADVVESLDSDVGALFHEGGEAALVALPCIGRGLAQAIAEIVVTGRWSRLEGLRGKQDPHRLLSGVPGIGPVFAKRIHDGLDIDTLEELEQAAYDGRLRKVAGLGRRRIASIKSSLVTILGNRRGRAKTQKPEIEQVLYIDRLYRDRAASGRLRFIAPKRFNPTHDPWLPIMHEDLSSWHFTALFSNTARAHELGKTFDWVVVYFESDEDGSGQATVVTETSGPLKGRRVVRGREYECERFYESYDRIHFSLTEQKAGEN